MPITVREMKRPAYSPGVAQSPKPSAGQVRYKIVEVAMPAKRLGMFCRPEGGRKGSLASAESSELMHSTSPTGFAPTPTEPVHPNHLVLQGLLKALALPPQAFVQQAAIPPTLPLRPRTNDIPLSV